MLNGDGVGVGARGAPERIAAVSDVHTDHASNFAWCEALAASPSCSSSVLLLAGDVSEKLARFEETLALLSSAFGAVFFVPGNHDLWCRKDGSEGADSVAKLERLERVCESLGARLRIDYVRSHLVSAVVIYKNCSRRGLGGDGPVSQTAYSVQPQRP